jgi:hypothetical protein
MGSWVRFPVLSWQFSLAREDPHSDHGLGSLYNLGLRPLPVLHAHIYIYIISLLTSLEQWVLIICCFTAPVHLLYFIVAPGSNTKVLLFYSPTVYSRYDRFCFAMLFTYCVFLVVINCGLHPLLYILETVHSCLSFCVLTRTKTPPEDGSRCRNM